MLQDAHSRKISIAVGAGPGATVVIPGVADAWIYVHTLIGDLTAPGTLDVISGSTVLASFILSAGQGITESDEPGEDNRPRFECPPGEDFILEVTGAAFNGAVHYSLRY